VLRSRPTRAVIVAAGLGTRLGGVKPLTPVAGIPILHRALRALAGAGVRGTVIVVGHRAEEIIAAVGDAFAGMRISYVTSDRFATTSNAYSLWLAREHLDTDLFLLDGDVVFDPEILTRLSDAEGSAVSAVCRWRPGLDGTVLDVGEHGLVRRVHLAQDQQPPLDRFHKTLNVHLLRVDYLRAEFVPLLDDLITGGGEQCFYEAVLARSRRFPIRAVDCGDLASQEVDDATDLEAADYRFGTAGQRLALLNSQHGGYWRHHVTDHSLLCNPYFPPPDMLDALTADFREALTHYPVGHGRLRELLAAATAVPAEHLVVANGASELIKVLGRILENVALVTPGFNEYQAVFPGGRLIALPGPDFGKDAEYLARASAGCATLILESPNNPTSAAMAPEELLRLCKLLATARTRLVVDESFVDFCAGGYSLEGSLADHPNLVIIKSMSKAYGIAGLRLGYLATADAAFLQQVTGELPIWNINGIAESFLRLLPRYLPAFESSLQQVRASRDLLYQQLLKLPALEYVHRPDANFVLARLSPPWRAADVVAELMERQGILVKDCTGKAMNSADRYLRLSSRTTTENQHLVAALTDILQPSSQPPEHIAAGGLLIRRWNRHDIPARQSALTASHDHLRRWLPWADPPPAHQDQQAYLRQCDQAWASGQEFSYGIFDTGTGQLLGAIALHARIGAGALEIGYWVHAHHTGNGIITRSVEALTQAALTINGIQRVEIHCDQANTASTAIPRRLGYHLDRIETRTPRTPSETGHWMIWSKHGNSQTPRSPSAP
jgi:histidinol-phosphate/aromatic aminotransferase/cobyric acid decarboxylase-like protein/RimJ/RimL family protein N-acetyltransferase